MKLEKLKSLSGLALLKVVPKNLEEITNKVLQDFNKLREERIFHLMDINESYIMRGISTEDSDFLHTRNNFSKNLGVSKGIFSTYSTSISHINAFSEMLTNAIENTKSDEIVSEEDESIPYTKGDEVRVGTRTRNILVKISSYPPEEDEFDAWVLNSGLEIIKNSYDKALILDSFRKDSTVM